jgi:dolichol-phosphate mannosyltransferase
MSCLVVSRYSASVKDIRAFKARALQRVAERHGRRFARFGAVGISGVLVNTGILWSLVSLLGFHHLVAAAISSEVSILTNFVLNDHWTFGDHSAKISYVRRAAHYNAVAIAGMALSLGVLAVLVDAFGLYYLLANLIAIGSATVSNYLLNMRFTWSLHRDKTSSREAATL